VKVEAFGEPVILSSDIEKLLANFSLYEALGDRTNTHRFLATVLSGW
jgi:hypothetical protein